MQCFASATAGNEVSPVVTNPVEMSPIVPACQTRSFRVPSSVEASAHVISCHGRDSRFPHFADEEGRFREVK